MKIVKAAQNTGFEIFEPLITATTQASIFISTWGLAPVDLMQDIVQQIEDNQPKIVRLLVGYSKTTHKPYELLRNIRNYIKIGWVVRALPSCHLKLWMVNDDAWNGSCNFTKSTIINLQSKVPKSEVGLVANHYWNQAATISDSTDLLLLPQAKEIII